jgi:hypothetical protein
VESEENVLGVINGVAVGDMILSRDQMEYLFANKTQGFGHVSPFKRWPNATVFYEIDSSLDDEAKKKVILAMEYIHNVSCVRFQIKDNRTKNYVLIKTGKVFASEVGMR